MFPNRMTGHLTFCYRLIAELSNPITDIFRERSWLTTQSNLHRLQKNMYDFLNFITSIVQKEEKKFSLRSFSVFQVVRKTLFWGCGKKLSNKNLTKKLSSTSFLHLLKSERLRQQMQCVRAHVLRRRYMDRQGLIYKTRRNIYFQNIFGS